MKILHIEPSAGIAGDMMLGSLIDLGVPLSYVQAELQKLKVPGVQIDVTQVKKKGIAGKKLQVIIAPDAPKPHRHLKDIRAIIENSEIMDGAKDRAIRIFTLLAEAEAKVHASTIEKIHFHEVGALDSIVDIVGTSIALDHLNPEKITAAKLAVGEGFVECEHGRMPVPVPASLEMIQVKGIPFYSKGVEGEISTPTGVAILGAMVNTFSNLAEGKILSTGYGAGNKDFPHANVLRTMLVEQLNQGKTDYWDSQEILLLEFHVDDMTGEQIGAFIQGALELGALDVYALAIQMKKSRPGYEIHVLCDIDQCNAFMDYTFKHSTTLGVRHRHERRAILKRSSMELNVDGVLVRVKKVEYEKGEYKFYPEHDSVEDLARKLNLSASESYQHILSRCQTK